MCLLSRLLLQSRRAHDRGRLLLRQSCLQQLVDRPSLFLEEEHNEQSVPRVEAILHHHRDIDWPLAKRGPQLLERPPVVYADIVGETFPCPSRYAKASEAEIFPDDDMREFVSA